MKPLISVIVPVYNVERYLSKCIDSILSQTYTNLEIILVDDGSTDACGQICDMYAAKDSRIKVIHKENGGVASARNVGLQHFSGEYLMFVDPDDYISCDAVQSMYERLAYDGSDMAIGKHMDVYEDGSTDGSFCAWMRDAVHSKQDILQKLGDANYYPVSNSAKMYKRDVFDGVQYPPLSCGEDVWAFTLIIDKCKRISVVDKTVYYYFQRSDSILHVRSEQTKRDDLNAVLHLVQFLWQAGYEISGRRWFALAVDKAFVLKEKRQGVVLFESCFTPGERKSLLKKQTIKIQLKWLCLRVPVLDAAVKNGKGLLGRK